MLQEDHPHPTPYICMLQEGDNAGNSFTGFCGLPAVQRDYEMSGMHAGTKRRKYRELGSRDVTPQSIPMLSLGKLGADAPWRGGESAPGCS